MVSLNIKHSKLWSILLENIWLSTILLISEGWDHFFMLKIHCTIVYISMLWWGWLKKYICKYRKKVYLLHNSTHYYLPIHKLQAGSVAPLLLLLRKAWKFWISSPVISVLGKSIPTYLVKSIGIYVVSRYLYSGGKIWQTQARCIR